LNSTYFMQQIRTYKFAFGVVCFQFDSGPRDIEKFARGCCVKFLKKVWEPLPSALGIISSSWIFDHIFVGVSRLHPNYVGLTGTFEFFRAVEEETDAENFRHIFIFHSGFPRGIESMEKILNREIGFQDLEKVLILAQMFMKYWKSMEILNSTICLFKFCSSPLITVLQVFSAL